MANNLSNFIKKLAKNKILIFILVAVIIVGGYLIYKKTANKEVTKYIIGQVSKGTINKTVSGSGYITIPDQLDVKSKIGGEVVYIEAKNNSFVNAGALILKIDSKNYEKQVEDAQFSLEMAQMSLEKLISQKEQTTNDLNKTYEDSFQNLSVIYGSLPSLVTTAKRVFESETLKEINLKDLDFYSQVVSFYNNLPYTKNQQIDSFNKLLSEYYNLFRDYQLLKLPLNQNDFDKFLESSYYTIKNLFDLIRNNRDNLLAYKDLYDNHSVFTEIPITTTVSQLNSLSEAATSLNQYLNTITSNRNTIEKYKTTLKNYEQDIKNQEYSIKQKENALKEAKDNLNNCYVRAPLSGTLTNFEIKKGDLISSNTALGTLITENKIAEITLTEIDAAMVKEGQSATLTFDALPEVTLKGQVTEVGLLGQTSAGVVSYPIKISIDPSPDLEKVKASMTVDANIVVEEKNDILTIPLTALKTRNEKSFVEVPDEADLTLIKSQTSTNQKQRSQKTVALKLPPKEKFVETGISDDENIEITSGLKEGDYIIIQTIAPGQNTSTLKQNSFFNNTQFRMGGSGMSPMMR